MKKTQISMMILMLLAVLLAGCGAQSSKESAVSHIVWGVFTNQEDSFPEEWQNGFNELLKAKGISAEVEFCPVIVDRRAEGLPIGSYQEYGELFAERVDGCDLFTDLGVFGFYQYYGNFIRKGLYEPLTPYLETETGTALRESYPEIFWEAMKANGTIYGVPSRYGIYDRSYGVLRKDAADAYGLTEEDSIGDLELLGLARRFSEEQGILYQVPGGELILPEEFETMWESDLLAAWNNGGEFQVDSMMENPVIQERIEAYDSYEKEDYWKYRFDPARNQLFGTYVRSYSPEAAVRTVCEMYGTDPEEYLAVKHRDLPFRQRGTVTGIWSGSKEKKAAFAVLQAAFSDPEIAEYLAYGQEGSEYRRENGFIVTVRPVTENSQIDTRCMTNHLLLTPEAVEDESKQTVLRDYYEQCQKSILCGVWFDYDAYKTEIKEMSRGVSENGWFLGAAADGMGIKESLLQMEEQLSDINLKGMEQEFSRQLRERK